MDLYCLSLHLYGMVHRARGYFTFTPDLAKHAGNGGNCLFGCDHDQLFFLEEPSASNVRPLPAPLPEYLASQLRRQ